MNRRVQILCALLTGVLVCCSFPTVLFGWRLPEMGWLGWVALVPLFVAVRGAEPRRAFALSFLAGLVLYAGSIYWLYRAMHTFGKLPPFTSALVLVLLVIILSVYLGLAPMLTRWFERRIGGEFIAWLAVLWTALEYARDHIPCNGYPWAHIGLSQWRMLPMIQIVDLVGVYGLMFLIVWVNAFLAEAVARWRGEAVRSLGAKAAVTALLLAATAGYGFWKLSLPEGPEVGAGTITAGLVQANIPQDEKWAEAKAVANLAKLRRMTQGLRETPLDLIVWPEASFPWPISTEAVGIDPQALGLDGSELGALPHLLVGALSERPDGEFYNSALLFDGRGRIAGRYHKTHLVPFGEYVPYKKLFYFARKLTEPVGNFLEGTSFEPLHAGAARVGVLICYEDVFPEVARKIAAQGAEVFVNVTNDAWYGVSSAPWQHLGLSVFRAVENRRYLLRATNTGISAVVAPSGRVSMETGLDQDAIIVAATGLRRDQTSYMRLGDWFAWGCIAYAVFGLMLAAKNWRRAKS